MLRVGQRRKRDRNEPEIVEALRQAGALVLRVSERGAPDLLVYTRVGVWVALEVKSRLGKATKAQAQRSAEGWPVTTVRTVPEALAAIGLVGDEHELHICRQPGFNPVYHRCLACAAAAKV